MKNRLITIYGLESARRAILLIAGLALLIGIQGCTSLNSFPTTARAGDTVSLMIGGTEKARKDTIDVTLTDANSNVFDLDALGFVRSVFNLRPDGRATGVHYSPYLDSQISWTSGHEPTQSVLVVDIPPTAAVGQATLTVSTHVDDDSSGIAPPANIGIEIIPGTGSPTNFRRQNSGGGSVAVDFTQLEPAPHAKISLGGNDRIGAATIVVDFDENVVNGDDINVYVPESNVRGSFTFTGQFGFNQRMVYWHQDGSQLTIDVVAPNGIPEQYLQFYLIHPTGLTGSPNLSIISSAFYDVNGNTLSAVSPALDYFP